MQYGLRSCFGAAGEGEKEEFVVSSITAFKIYKPFAKRWQGNVWNTEWYLYCCGTLGVLPPKFCTLGTILCG
jgi:hypothetical protein